MMSSAFGRRKMQSFLSGFKTDFTGSLGMKAFTDFPNQIIGG
jgi:hypothetical protein